MRPLGIRTPSACACGGGFGRCSLRSPPTINTNGAAEGCKEVYLWCQEASGARCVLVDDNRSASARKPHALYLQGRLQYMLAEIAPNNQYYLRWTSGVRLIKRPPARRIPWFGLVVKLRYLFSLIFSVFESRSGIEINLKNEVISKHSSHCTGT